LPSVALIFGPPALLLGLTAWISATTQLEPAFFTRDPAAAMDAHPLTGVQSHLGVLVWWSAGVVSLFVAGVVRRRAGTAQLAAFLLWSGAITVVFALDDLFLLHEDLIERLIPRGEKVLFLAYATALAWGLVRFREVIRESEWALLAVALLLFGASMTVDFLVQPRWDSPWRIYVEDGLKLLGIAAWSGYLIRMCRDALSPSPAPPSVRPPALRTSGRSPA
jgi:hypothetical protein